MPNGVAAYSPVMRLLLLAVVFAVLAGCAGSRFTFDNARQVKPGMSESDVTQLLGPPYSVTSRGDTQIWVWSYANGLTGAHQSVAFPMQGGKVVSVPTIPASFR